MFPGFVSIYKDDNGYINLYFYPGLSVDVKDIYWPLELTNEYEYIKNIREDKSVIYQFINKKIKKIKCKLISHNNDYKTITLEI